MCGQDDNMVMRMKNWVLGRPQEHFGMLMGGPACGKTTLLCKAIYGEQKFSTIPTVGFSELAVEHSRRRLSILDTGGGGKLRPILLHHFTGREFLVYVFDCNCEQEQFQQEIKELKLALPEFIRDAAGNHVWIVLNKQDLLPPRTRSQIVEDMHSALSTALAPFNQLLDINIFKSHVFSAVDSYSVAALLDDITKTLACDQAKSKSKSQEAAATYADISLARNVSKCLAYDHLSPSAFWAKLCDGTLPAWPHYYSLRARYFVMLDGLASGYGVLICADNYIQRLERLRKMRPEKVLEKPNMTVTVFWLYQLQLAASKYKTAKSLIGLPRRDDFGAVLMNSPHLVNAELWKEYYSDNVIFSPDAQHNWRLPDKKALPPVPGAAVRRIQADGGFQIEDNRVLQFGLDVAQTMLRTNMRRGPAIKSSLAGLETCIMRMRAADPSVPQYSETQAHFWIQFVHSALSSVQAASADAGKSAAVGWHGSLDTLTLPAFTAMFDITGNEWQECYSRSLWESMRARMHFVNPDKNPLPGPAMDITSQPGWSWPPGLMASKPGRYITPSPEMPPPASLSMMVAAVCDEAAMSDTDSVWSAVKTHPQRIVSLYDTLIATGAEEEKCSVKILEPQRRRALKERIDRAMQVSGPGTDCVTLRIFWIQQMLAAAATTRPGVSFDDFLCANPHLACDGLPLLYYSGGVILSKGARDTFIPPDIKPFQSFM